MRQGLTLTIGAVVGAAGALALDRLLGSFVLGSSGDRAIALATAALANIAPALLASVVPCLRALHIVPARILRYE